MARFKKDALAAGRYSVPDETGARRRVVEYTSDDIAHLAGRYREMRAAGLAVPLVWEHQDDHRADRADRLAARAKHVCGWLDGMDATATTLAFELDVPAAADAERLPSVRFVSPEIVTDYVDGDGRLWPGKSITHLAATPLPVQHRQGEFQQLSVVRLSLADRLGDTPMADKKDDRKDADKDDKKGGDGNLKGLIEALKSAGLNIPKEATSIDDLIIAIKASGGGGDKDAPPPPPPGGGAPKDADMGGGPVAMSLQRRVQALEGQLVAAERGRLKGRVEAVFQSGRVSKVIRDNLMNSANSVKLSLDEDGKLAATSLEAKVEAYEALPAGTVWTPERLSRVREVDMGAGDGGVRAAPQTEQETDAIVADIDRMLGRGGKS